MSVILGPIIMSQKTYAATMISITVLTAIAEVFLILAALQVLPHGVNVMSQLSLGGVIGSSIAIATPLIIALLLKLCMYKTDGENRQQYKAEQFNTDQSSANAIQETDAAYLAEGEF